MAQSASGPTGQRGYSRYGKHSRPVCIAGAPWFAVEVKTLTVSKHLRYFAQRLEIPWCYQVVGEGDVDFFKDGVRVMVVDRFLGALV